MGPHLSLCKNGQPCYSVPPLKFSNTPKTTISNCWKCRGYSLYSQRRANVSSGKKTLAGEFEMSGMITERPRGSVLVFIDTQRTRKLRPFYNFSRCSLADDAVRKNDLETLKCHLARVMHPTQQSFRRPQTRCTSSASAFYQAFHTRTSYRS